MGVVVRLVSVNAFNLYDGDAPAAEERFARLEALVRGLDADVLAVQEIVAREPGPRDPGKRDLAVTRLRRLAKAVDRQWKHDGEPVLALGGGIHHTALLWRDGITPVPGTLGRFEREGAGMWHSMVTCVFDLGGPRLRVGSVQLSPFDQAWGWSDAAQILRAMHSDDVPGVVGGDFNGVGATKVALLDGGETFYDDDPYLHQPWHPNHAYQLDEHGRLDRRVAIRLEHLGRMRDCARIAGTPWAATTGFHPADNHPPRRIDRWYATHHVPDAAVRGVEVVDHAAVGQCTDHAPVILDLDPGALTR
ncbi:endonuclease/exonuclease/phosphatase family protein [Amycolatopsis sp. NPDC051903]|uniref:endonuclease/exonuclease/phosphatase family protein n=1 Tax=Amycolatopsis sp. NPDC051903 TaxID=3363936 RepID=UPI003794E021